MRNMIYIVIGMMLVAGCSYGKDKVGYLMENPPGILKDKEFAAYEEEKQQIESAYLKKEITYAEYREKLNALEDDYTRQVDRRTGIIEGDM